MKALVKTKSGAGNLAYTEWPKPSPGRGEVLIAVKAVGVCGTDVHIMHGTYRTATPVVIGHEFSGVIVEVGPETKRWRVGDRVVVENTVGACGVCELCRTGTGHICLEKRAYGTDSDGAMTEFVVFSGAAVHRLPDSVSFEEAAVVEPLAVVNRGVVERGCVRPESTVVVIGPGSIGLLAVQVCRAAGAKEIILAGTNKDVATRLSLGKQCGATRVVNVQQEDLRAIVSEVTGGAGADLVVEASGSPKAVQEAIHLAGRGKVVSVIGLTGGQVTLDWDAAVFKEIDIRFSKSSTYLSWHRAISMIADGRVDVKLLITHRFKLSQWAEALQATDKGEAIKAVMFPEPGAASGQ